MERRRVMSLRKVSCDSISLPLFEAERVASAKSHDTRQSKADIFEDELSEEDQQLKDELEMLVERLKV